MTTKKGTIGNDNLIGSAVFDRLFGDLGNDVINGAAGDDQLFGGEGNDRLIGGLGHDRLVGGAGADNLQGGDGDDILNGGDGFNVFGIDIAKDVLDGGVGNDFITFSRNDVVIGGAGDHDVASFQYLGGAAATLYKLDFSHIDSANPVAIASGTSIFKNTFVGSTESINMFLSGAAGGSSVIGSSGDDMVSVSTIFTAPGTLGVGIQGGAGNDELHGSFKNDTINGQAGNDIVDGGFGGKDQLIGGLGEDAFVFNVQDTQSLTPATADVIADFQRGQDIVAIATDSSFGGLNFGNQQNLLLSTANPLNGTTAPDIAQMIYETDTGKLFIDDNGSTDDGLHLLATLSGRPAITAADILIEYNFI